MLDDDQFGSSNFKIGLWNLRKVNNRYKVPYNFDPKYSQYYFYYTVLGSDVLMFFSLG